MELHYGFYDTIQSIHCKAKVIYFLNNFNSCILIEEGMCEFKFDIELSYMTLLII